jgi:hypothetical protein
MIKGKSPDFDCLGLSDASLNGKADWRAWRRLVDITSQRENELPANSIQVKMSKTTGSSNAKRRPGQSARWLRCNTHTNNLRWKWILSIPYKSSGGHLSTASSSHFIMQHTHTLLQAVPQPLQCRSFLIRDEIFPSFFLVRPLSQR